MASTATIDTLIQQWRGGDTAARDTLVAALYPELRTIASAQMRRERNVSFSSGDLVNDAVLRLVQLGHVTLNDRAHIMALASRLMRNIVIDHARARHTDKRAHLKVPLDEGLDGEKMPDLIALETALVRLGQIDAALVELVEMRYYGGMGLGDIAVVTGLSEATLKRRWRTARAWLADALARPLDAL